MQRPEEEARREGIRLLEVHVKLLREARAALCSPGRGAEDKLPREIEKVEKKFEVWRRRYEDLYLHGNDLWDLIEKEEELERKRKREQKMKEEEDIKLRVKIRSKNLREKKNRGLGKIIYEIEEGEEKMTEDDEQKAISGKQLTAVTSLVEDKREGKEEEIMSQPRNENEEVERLRPHKREEEGCKRPREEMEENDGDGEKCVKRKRSDRADTSVARQAEGHRVLVSNIPLSVQYTELRAYFMQFGALSKVYLKCDSGYGSVVYENEDIADLVCGLHHRLGGQDVRVMKVTPQRYPPAGPEPIAAECAVLVLGVKPGTDPQQVRSAFAWFGQVTRVVQPNGKNYAFVEFEKENNKEAALQARRVPLNGGTLTIHRVKTSSDDSRTSRGNEEGKETAVTPVVRPRHGYRVFVYGIKIPMDTHCFQMSLAHFGTVVSAYMPEDKNYAFVGFDTQEAQQAALKAGSVNLPCGRAIIRPVTRR